MKNGMKFAVIAIVSVLAIPVFFMTLAYIADALKNSHISSVTEPKFRLMCWLPNGVPFYDGFASDVIGTNSNFFSFIPTEGPQAGHRIYTTTACTWMELK
jgi:hypothetical protein